MFGNWLAGVDKKTKARIRIGVCAFIWTIWNCRNDIVFNKTVAVHFLQVVHKDLLDQLMVPSAAARAACAYGFRVHSVDGGRSGYLQPGWPVSC